MASSPSTIREVIKDPDGTGPAWEIAELFPDQGHLEQNDYLFLTERTNRLVEFIDGRIEVLEMPTTEHQRIVLYLVKLLSAFVELRSLGLALMAPLRVKLRQGQIREPDVLFMLEQNLSRVGNQYWEGADLVMEVISEDDPNRDLQTKRLEYAEAGISEYWLCDPRSKTITVLKLVGGQYAVHSEASGTGRVQSALLNGFVVDVASAFAAGRPK
jgi:Uma2 family endonuclease